MCRIIEYKNWALIFFAVGWRYFLQAENVFLLKEITPAALVINV